jgi:hypothetical protein
MKGTYIKIRQGYSKENEQLLQSVYFAQTSMTTLYLHQCWININDKIISQLIRIMHFKRLYTIHFLKSEIYSRVTTNNIS